MKKKFQKKTTKGKRSGAVNFLDFVDSDADGLSDKEERMLGTDPFAADSDRDGLSDLAEIKIYRTNPLNPDTDFDGISDGEEVKQGLDPLVPNFRDFFIPHAGNNHQPQILSTKRAIFYSLFFLLSKIGIFAFAVAIPAQAFLAPDILEEQRNKLYFLVNQLRGEEQSRNLATEEKLVFSAQAKSADMAENQYFSHVGPENRDLAYFLSRAGYQYRVAGENLAMGFSDVGEVIRAWVKSPLHYQNLIDNDFEEMGIGMESGLYGQNPTIFIAQHFGSPLASAAFPALEAENLGASALESDRVLGQKTSLPVQPTETDGRGPVRTEYDRESSRVFWRYDGEKTTFTAKAYIAGAVSQAMVYLDDYLIDLQLNEEENLYVGSLTVAAPVDNFFQVVVDPTIKILTPEDEVIIGPIKWYQAKSVSQTPIQKYFSAKTMLPALTGKVFTASKAVYAGAIIIFSLVLLLSILIEIRKQHPHIIVQTLSLILLLGTLLMI